MRKSLPWEAVRASGSLGRSGAQPPLFTSAPGGTEYDDNDGDQEMSSWHEEPDTIVGSYTELKLSL